MEFTIPQDPYPKHLLTLPDSYGLQKLSIFNQTPRHPTIQFSFNDAKQHVTQVVERIASYSLHRHKISQIRSEYSPDYQQLERHRMLSNAKRAQHGFNQLKTEIEHSRNNQHLLKHLLEISKDKTHFLAGTPAERQKRDQINEINRQNYLLKTKRQNELIDQGNKRLLHRIVTTPGSINNRQMMTSYRKVIEFKRMRSRQTSIETAEILLNKSERLRESQTGHKYMATTLVTQNSPSKDQSTAKHAKQSKRKPVQQQIPEEVSETNSSDLQRPANSYEIFKDTSKERIFLLPNSQTSTPKQSAQHYSDDDFI